MTIRVDNASDAPRRVFKVKTPSGVFADGEWATREEIPPRLPDRFEHYFDTDEAEIVEVELTAARAVTIEE